MNGGHPATHRTAHSMKSLHTAIRHLDPTSLARLLPESLTQGEIEALLVLADEAATEEISKTASHIAKAEPADIARLALDHSLCMQNYLSVRAILCEDLEAEDDDLGNLGIF